MHPPPPPTPSSNSLHLLDCIQGCRVSGGGLYQLMPPPLRRQGEVNMHGGRVGESRPIILDHCKPLLNNINCHCTFGCMRGNKQGYRGNDGIYDLPINACLQFHNEVSCKPCKITFHELCFPIICFIVFTNFHIKASNNIKVGFIILFTGNKLFLSVCNSG